MNRLIGGNTLDTEETKQITAEHPEGASSVTATASAAPTPITETPEFKAMVEATATRMAQSMKDKELKPVYQKLEQLERDRQKEREAREALERQAKEEVEIDKLYKGLIEEGVSDESASSFREKAKQLSRDLVRKATTHNEVAEKVAREKAEIEERAKSLSLKESILLVMDAAEAQGKTLKKSEAERIAKESEGHPKLIEYMVKVSSEQPVTPLPEKQKEIKRPDSSLNTASGGRMSNEELKISYIQGKIGVVAYEEECKKRGIPPI